VEVRDIADKEVNADIIKKNRKRREKILKKYSFNMSDFKFDRDEANDYD